MLPLNNAPKTFTIPTRHPQRTNKDTARIMTPSKIFIFILTVYNQSKKLF